MTRAAIYRRMSKGKDTDDWQERQADDGRKIADRMGGTVAPEDIFTDKVSASRFSKKERKGYSDLLDAVQKPDGPKIVVCWMEDRAHRQILELAEFIEICREHNVRVATPNAEYDLDDPDQLTMWYFKVRFAEAEVEKMSKRLRRQRLQAAQNGQPHVGSPRHFGFQKWVKAKDGSIVAGNAVPMRRVLEEQEQIREAIRRLLAGDTVRGIVQDWNTRKIKTATGDEWTRASLRRVVMSPALVGRRVHNGDTYLATWKPVVDVDDWKAVVGLLTDPSRVVTRGRGPAYLLTGLIYCGVCGHRMRAYYHGGDDAKYYRCDNWAPDARLPRLTRLVSFVDTEVEKRIFYRLDSTASEQAANGAQTPADPTSALYAELARLQGLIDRLEDKIADELISPPTAKRKRGEYERSQERVRGKLGTVQGTRVLTRIPPNLPTVWPDLSLDRKRAILAALIERVDIHPSGPVGSGQSNPDLIKITYRDKPGVQA
ncbi:MAG TPA: recombinase family protein [Actinomycetes bacterium]|nr:recombinase family protein [Actinomycetes bacterium]